MNKYIREFIDYLSTEKDVTESHRMHTSGCIEFARIVQEKYNLSLDEAKQR